MPLRRRPAVRRAKSKTSSPRLIGPEQRRRLLAAPSATPTSPQDDIHLIKQTGFNSVRIPIHCKFFTTDDAEGFRLLDRVIEWCTQRRPLRHHRPPLRPRRPDRHQHRRQLRLALALSRRRQPSSRPSTSGSASPTTTATSRTSSATTCSTSPSPTTRSCASYNAELEPLYKRITAAIRAGDPNHAIILGGAQWDSDFTVFGPPFDNNVIYQLHNYWTATTSRRDPEIPRLPRQYHVPIWLGESGENKDEWIAPFARTLEKNHIGWGFWPYKKMDATSSVVTFDRPEHWDQIIALAKMAPRHRQRRKAHRRPPLAGRMRRPSFDDLLKKVQFSNEHVNEGYVHALGLTATTQ